MKEETGLEFELTSLILVESSGGSWFRFSSSPHCEIGGDEQDEQVLIVELLDNSGGCHDDRKLRRFMVTGDITGGHLKTPAEADKESIQVFRQGTKSWRRKIHHVNHVNCISVSIKANNHTQPYHHHLHHPRPHNRANTHTGKMD